MALSTGRSGENSMSLLQETHRAGLWKALNARSPHISGGIPEMVKWWERLLAGGWPFH